MTHANLNISIRSIDRLQLLVNYETGHETFGTYVNETRQTQYSSGCVLPSLSADSAAWPLLKIVLTKMPMSPRGESRPPTMLNPRPFPPADFVNRTCNIIKGQLYNMTLTNYKGV